MAPVPADRAGELRADDLRSGGLAAAESVEPLVFNPNNAVTGAVERLRLTDGTSVVRKVLRGDAPATVAHWAAGANPTHWNHWRREADAYDSGAVRAFEPHVRAPQLLARVSSRPGREVLFLEDVDGPSGFDLRGAPRHRGRGARPGAGCSRHGSMAGVPLRFEGVDVGLLVQPTPGARRLSGCALVGAPGGGGRVR